MSAVADAPEAATRDDVTLQGCYHLISATSGVVLMSGRLLCRAYGYRFDHRGLVLSHKRQISRAFLESFRHSQMYEVSHIQLAVPACSNRRVAMLNSISAGQPCSHA